jgi:dTDP-4-amino-4,6-dideoxygalactose transaminase
MAEICAAVLLGQLEDFHNLQKIREDNWRNYRDSLAGFEDLFSILENPEKEIAHMFAVLTRSEEDRDYLRNYLSNFGIHATSHYEPLDQSLAGKKFGRSSASGEQASRLSKTILRLPLWTKPMSEEINFIAKTIAGLKDVRP